MEDLKNQKIRISLLYYPILTLGPFDRVGLWLQGCSIRCKGCMSKHTWSFSGGFMADIDYLVRDILKFGCKRLTISGGEPLDQYEALIMLLEKLRLHMEDILLYTGYDMEMVYKKFEKVLNFADVIIAGPYIETQPTKSKLKGSENQRVLFLNHKLKEIYKKYDSSSKIAQRLEYNGLIYIVGVPERWRS